MKRQQQNDLPEDVWDDSALIKAYQTAVNKYMVRDCTSWSVLTHFVIRRHTPDVSSKRMIRKRRFLNNKQKKWQKISNQKRPPSRFVFITMWSSFSIINKLISIRSNTTACQTQIHTTKTTIMIIIIITPNIINNTCHQHRHRLSPWYLYLPTVLNIIPPIKPWVSCTWSKNRLTRCRRYHHLQGVRVWTMLCNNSYSLGTSLDMQLVTIKRSRNYHGRNKTRNIEDECWMNYSNEDKKVCLLWNKYKRMKREIITEINEKYRGRSRSRDCMITNQA